MRCRRPYSRSYSKFPSYLCDVCLWPKAMGWTPPHLSASKCQTESVSNAVNGKKESTMKINRVGVDLAKNVFQVHGVDGRGKVVWKRQLKRSNWISSSGL